MWMMLQHLHVNDDDDDLRNGKQLDFLQVGVSYKVSEVRKSDSVSVLTDQICAGFVPKGPTQKIPRKLMIHHSSTSLV